MTIQYKTVLGAWAMAAGLTCGTALAESRFALVIGNSAYETVSVLPNPANDARAMTDLLTRAGFDVANAGDLSQVAMRKAIGEFAAKVALAGPDSVALVFYAGHGVQVDGENFLVPVDARINRESDVPLQAVRLADLMNTLSTIPSKTRIVILDACRNNPFSEINKVTGRGLAIVDAPPGSIVSYSTSPGAEAEDGAGANSPYTSAILNIAAQPGLPIEQAFKQARLVVHQATDGRQTPWESSSLKNDFFFFPGAAGGTPAAGAKAGAAKSVAVWTRELRGLGPQQAYDLVIREDRAEAYQAFIAINGAPPFGPRVRGLLNRRQEMVAWYTAVTINTSASFEVFLASYPTSDLAQTARRLLERARNRSLDAQSGLQLASIGPTCPCSAPTPATPSQPKKASKPVKEKPTREVKRTPPRRPVEEPVPVRQPGPSPVQAIDIGIGIGFGGFGGGGRRSGGHSKPHGF